MQDLEETTRSVGREIIAGIGRRAPTIFNRGWWQGKVLDWCMKDPAFKVELFRFVDVFPTLTTPVEIARHLKEYFTRPGQDFPKLVRMGVEALPPESLRARLASKAISHNMGRMARVFIAGRTAEEALDEIRGMRRVPVGLVVDLLGEAVVSEKEAEVYQRRYLDLIDRLSETASGWQEVPVIDTDSEGPIPKVQVSLKLSSLYSQMDPIDPARSEDAVKARLRPILERAKERGAAVTVDMEHYTLKDLTLRIFCNLLEEPGLAEWPHGGIAIQSYLRGAEEDLETLLSWARRRPAPISVRLVKGAYWDSETVVARQQGWPVPVFEEKWETDATYERMSGKLLEAHPKVRPAFGTHNVRSIAHAIAWARNRGIPDSAYEIQLLHGMAEPIKETLVQMGLRVRNYVPVGELIPGMAYLVRRLLENTSNESFLRLSFAEGASADALLAPPAPREPKGGRAETRPAGEGGAPRTEARPIGGADSPKAEARPAEGAGAPKRESRPAGEGGAPKREGQPAGEGGAPRTEAPAPEGPVPFENEPHTDFSLEESRRAFADALKKVRGTIGGEVPLVIGGERVTTGTWLTTRNPARPSEVIARVAGAGVKEIERTIEMARRATWPDASPEERAGVLFRAAGIMRKRRNELAALEVLEAGKAWREADADVAEAIDFCDYYGRRMLELGVPLRLGRYPGELNHLVYRARGIASVISPWNFPLAIPMGMASAALVAGNPVLFKPAPQALGVGAKLAEILLEAGAPPDAFHFVPGDVSQIGDMLIEHPLIHLIAFTGSRKVGLMICDKAAKVGPGQRAIKRVIAELGGKNAVIVDADADLDEAVPGIVYSAFGYQGQKCSACSRVIALEAVHDALLERLVEATKSVIIGPPEEPATLVGPLIDETARNRVLSYIKRGEAEARLVLKRDAPSEGTYVGPTIFADVKPAYQIAREEIFGPVLGVMRAKTFADAIEIANSTDYALTGGVFSRSPANIERATRDFAVGNLYINRGITGALVGRQAFGGFRLSGIGSKAGGPDYLLQFLEPRTITENTLRRGFAPEV